MSIGARDQKARHSTSGREAATRGYTPPVMTSPDSTSSSIPARALFELWDGHARARPERLVVRSPGAGLSMNAAALSRRIHAMSEALAREGVGAGDLVLVQGLVGLPFVVGLLGVWARDATALA